MGLLFDEGGEANPREEGVKYRITALEKLYERGRLSHRELRTKLERFRRRTGLSRREFMRYRRVAHSVALKVKILGALQAAAVHQQAQVPEGVAYKYLRLAQLRHRGLLDERAYRVKMKRVARRNLLTDLQIRHLSAAIQQKLFLDRVAGAMRRASHLDDDHPVHTILEANRNYESGDLTKRQFHKAKRLISRSAKIKLAALEELAAAKDLAQEVTDAFADSLSAESDASTSRVWDRIRSQFSTPAGRATYLHTTGAPVPSLAAATFQLLRNRRHQSVEVTVEAPAPSPPEASSLEEVASSPRTDDDDDDVPPSSSPRADASDDELDEASAAQTRLDLREEIKTVRLEDSSRIFATLMAALPSRDTVDIELEERQLTDDALSRRRQDSETTTRPRRPKSNTVVSDDSEVEAARAAQQEVWDLPTSSCDQGHVDLGIRRDDQREAPIPRQAVDHGVEEEKSAVPPRSSLSTETLFAARPVSPKSPDVPWREINAAKKHEKTRFWWSSSSRKQPDDIVESAVVGNEDNNSSDESRLPKLPNSPSASVKGTLPKAAGAIPKSGSSSSSSTKTGWLSSLSGGQSSGIFSSSSSSRPTAPKTPKISEDASTTTSADGGGPRSKTPTKRGGGSMFGLPRL